jgi:hypothetical protein
MIKPTQKKTLNHIKTTKNTQKHPKTPQNTPKTPIKALKLDPRGLVNIRPRDLFPRNRRQVTAGNLMGK